MNKFIFFYSPLYDYYNNHLVNTLSNYFIVEPILINDINNDKKGHTFFGGVSVKIELIINKIKENFNNFIIFSDATIFVNLKNVSLLSNFFDKYKKYDLCFADNDGTGYYNIGIILIKCNQQTLSFFEKVLFELIKVRGWDQNIINILLEQNNDLLVNVFDKQKIICGWDFNQAHKDTYYIYKSFIHHESNIIINYNKRLEIFHKAGLINDEEYNNNIKNTQSPNEFDWKTYVNNYMDLQNAGINTEPHAKWHWFNYGIKEGRTYKKI